MKSNRKSCVIVWPGPWPSVGELPPLAPVRQQFHRNPNRAADYIEDSAADDSNSDLFQAWYELMAGTGSKR